MYATGHQRVLADNATLPTWYTHYAVVDFADLVYLGVGRAVAPAARDTCDVASDGLLHFEGCWKVLADECAGVGVVPVSAMSSIKS